MVSDVEINYVLVVLVVYRQDYFRVTLKVDFWLLPGMIMFV